MNTASASEKPFPLMVWLKLVVAALAVVFFALGFLQARADLGVNDEEGPHSDLKPGAIARIDLIRGKTAVEIQGDQGSRQAKVGDFLFNGDRLATKAETVILALRFSNELQLAPHTSVTIEGVDDDASQVDTVHLHEGILWGLVAYSYSLAQPLMIIADGAAIAVPMANFVMESVPATRKVTVLTLEGNIKVAAQKSELSNPRKAVFSGTLMRVHSEGGKLNPPKPFKKSVLISYLNSKAKPMAEDMAVRGRRALVAIAQKNQAKVGDDDMTWNGAALAPAPGPAPAAGAAGALGAATPPQPGSPSAKTGGAAEGASGFTKDDKGVMQTAPESAVPYF